MRILIVNYEFPPVGGGGGRVSADIARFLAKREHEVHIFTAMIRGVPRTEERDGYHIFRHQSFRRRKDTCSVLEMGWFILLNIVPLINHVRKWQPDLVHIHFAVPTGVLGPIIKLITGTPYVLTVHLGDVPGGVPEQTDVLFKFLHPLTVPIWRHAAAVTAVSRHVRDLAVGSYPGVNVCVINNGVSAVSALREAGGTRNEIRLIFAGRLSVQKNPLFLVSLLKKVDDLLWKMDIVGDGPLLETTRRYIRELGLVDRIILYGWQTHDYVQSIMRNADILLLPSQGEGFSMVAAEALSYGLAIIASNVGGNMDIVQDEINGYLCPVGDLDCFAERLRRLLTSNELLDSMQIASRTSAARFDAHAIGVRYETLFFDVIGRNARK